MTTISWWGNAEKSRENSSRRLGRLASTKGFGWYADGSNPIDILIYTHYTHSMSVRLQVVMDESELEKIRASAKERGMTVSEFVRETLRDARRQVPSGKAERKIAAIRTANGYAYPTADIDQMLGEIERGYGETGE